jgi:RNA polymerase sigma-70 factor (ECF subfamily)
VNRPREADDAGADERLLADFLAGDEAGFSELVQRYAPQVFQFVSRFVRDPAAADDLVQETFVQVYQSAGGFDPMRRLRPWLFTIAANKARDYLRSRGRRKEISLASPMTGDDDSTSFLDFLGEETTSPGDAAEAAEVRREVRAIVDAMPDHLREVLLLGYYERFAYKEIAEMLDIPLGTVKSRLHAAVSHFATAYRRKQAGAGR